MHFVDFEEIVCGFEDMVIFHLFIYLSVMDIKTK